MTPMFASNPTRERGQWTGDSVNVGLEMGSCSFADLRPFRRALVQAAQSANGDGLVAAMSAGFGQYIASFAAQWTRACLRYHEITGEQELLRELAPAAIANARAFEKRIDERGVDETMTWNFIDWGYVRPEGPSDLGLNLFVRDSMRALAEWARRIGGSGEMEELAKRLGQKLDDALAPWGDALRTGDFGRLGYHATVLALRFDLVEAEHRRAAARRIVQHWDASFPLQPTETPLYSPAAEMPPAAAARRRGSR